MTGAPQMAWIKIPRQSSGGMRWSAPLLLAALLLFGCLQQLQPSPTPTQQPAQAPAISPTPVASPEAPAVSPTPAPTATPEAQQEREWSVNSNPSPLDDRMNAIAYDLAGFVYAGGTATVGDTSDTEWQVEKLNSSTGEVVWRYASRPGPNSRLTALALDNSGNLFLGGNELVAGSDFRWRVEKLGKDGSSKWNYTENPSTFFDTVNSIAVDSQSGAVYAGGSESIKATPENLYTTGSQIRVEKLDPSSGQRLWVYTSNPNGRVASAQALACDPSGYVYIAALDRSPTESGWRVEKVMAGSGSSVWNYTSGAGDTMRIPFAAAVNGDGGLYVAGVESLPGALNSSWLVERLASSGSLVWSYASDPSTNYDEALAIAHGPDGSVYVAGYEGDDRTAAATSVWRVERLSSSGSPVWARQLRASGDRGQARAAAFGGGFLFVAGFERVSGKDYRMRVDRIRG